jgi:hypothetical protein
MQLIECKTEEPSADILEVMDEAIVAAGAYDGVQDPGALGVLLTEHLRGIAPDRHLHVEEFAPGPMGGLGRGGRLFGESRRLEENIAYVEVQTFGIPPAESGDEIREVMSAAADAVALIVDVRNNAVAIPKPWRG